MTIIFLYLTCDQYPFFFVRILARIDLGPSNDILFDVITSAKTLFPNILKYRVMEIRTPVYLIMGMGRKRDKIKLIVNRTDGIPDRRYTRSELFARMQLGEWEKSD